jgi:hypothetical protein
MTNNPYEPTLCIEPIDAPSIEPDSRFVFEGMIEREDYANLLPNRHFLWWLQVNVIGASCTSAHRWFCNHRRRCDGRWFDARDFRRRCRCLRSDDSRNRDYLCDGAPEREAAFT